ncbi:GTA-gp10 family protein [Roseisolibacter sp. H3M3-2]|uniref:GTA-gp10 family protein n=1 Tax=Roseisolibacter sp. H3M3-2 TaxID=3031323 RepID=UPI0023DAC7E5|nr:GTA-gp10 family protein [Roseisolibacter sp. H3M3-2]MDF1506263.1 GTA-gp10 family protein [Roseisolibacter sp. H3M3-2]
MKRQKRAPAEPVANEDRGEHQLALAGRSYLLRPSHQALKAVERQTGKTALELVRLGNTGKLSMEDLGVVASELIRAGADPKDGFTRNVNAERLEELIFEEGLPTVTSKLTLCLLDAATGGRTAAGELKAAQANPKELAGAA